MEGTQTPLTTTLEQLKVLVLYMGGTLYDATTVHAQSPCTLSEIRQVSYEIWAKTAMSRCANLITINLVMQLLTEVHLVNAYLKVMNVVTI